MATVYELADRIVGGNLPQLLIDWRSNGDSYNGIARRLRNTWGIDVTAEAIRQWVRAIRAQEEAEEVVA